MKTNELESQIAYNKTLLPKLHLTQHHLNLEYYFNFGIFLLLNLVIFILLLFPLVSLEYTLLFGLCSYLYFLVPLTPKVIKNKENIKEVARLIKENELAIREGYKLI